MRLSLAFVVAQVLYGLQSHSLALLAGSSFQICGMLSELRSRNTPIENWLKQTSLLLVGTGAIAWEAVGRLCLAQAVDTSVVMKVAAAGVMIYVVKAALSSNSNAVPFYRIGRAAIVSAGIFIGALFMERAETVWLDPALALAISLMNGVEIWQLLKSSLKPFSQNDSRVSEVLDFLCEAPFSDGMQDLHLWALNTTETEHVVPVGPELRERFGVSHVLVQWKSPPDNNSSFTNGGLTLEYGPGFNLNP